MSRYIRNATVLLLLLLHNAEVLANPWTIELRKWSASQIDDSQQLDSEDIERNQFSISYLWSNEQTDTTLSYGYQPVLIRDGDPAHNGYFHQFDLSFHFQRGPTQVEFASGIHSSSNMLKVLEFHNEALVFVFSVMHSLSDDAAQIGINGDYRFGHFQLYPRVSVSKAFSKGSELIIDLPVALLWQYQRWQIGMTRYGEKWAALDSTNEVESAFYLNEWRFGVKWRSHESKSKVDFGLGAGISFNTRVHYLDLVRGWQDKDLESAVFLEAGINF